MLSHCWLVFATSLSACTSRCIVSFFVYLVFIIYNDPCIHSHSRCVDNPYGMGALVRTVPPVRSSPSVRSISRLSYLSVCSITSVCPTFFCVLHSSSQHLSYLLSRLLSLQLLKSFNAVSGIDIRQSQRLAVVRYRSVPNPPQQCVHIDDCLI